MTREAFLQRFSPDELELLCSRIEFLDVISLETFNLDLVEDAAHRVLDIDSVKFSLCFAA
jgi:hypothetical protein